MSFDQNSANWTQQKVIHTWHFDFISTLAELKKKLKTQSKIIFCKDVKHLTRKQRNRVFNENAWKICAEIKITNGKLSVNL